MMLNREKYQRRKRKIMLYPLQKEYGYYYDYDINILKKFTLTSIQMLVSKGVKIHKSRSLSKKEWQKLYREYRIFNNPELDTTDIFKYLNIKRKTSVKMCDRLQVENLVKMGFLLGGIAGLHILFNISQIACRNWYSQSLLTKEEIQAIIKIYLKQEKYSYKDIYSFLLIFSNNFDTLYYHCY